MQDRQTDGRQTTDAATETEGSHTKCASLIILLNFYSLLSKISLPACKCLEFGESGGVVGGGGRW